MCKESICRWSVVVVAVLVLLIYGPVARADTVLTFEGISNFAHIGDFYNGGGGGNLGISFDFGTALVSVLNGGSGNFANAPSGDTAAIFLVGETMNVPAGFATFSFFYSEANQGGPPSVVSVWSGLNATGTLLGELSLPVNSFCGFPNWCVWTGETVNFTGTAESVQFGSSVFENDVFFDNVTVGEPGIMLLLGIGSLGLAGLRHKKAA